MRPALPCRGLGSALVLALASASLAPGASRPFDLQGHRGARGLAPENTLPAFARALGLGVSTLELDVVVTKDGVVVVSHDPALNPDHTRGPDGKWLEKEGAPLNTLTLAEVQRYDVGRLKPGTLYAAQYPDQVPMDGTRIPTLAEVYDLARKAGNDQVRFNVETKLDPRQPGLTPAPEAFAEAVVKVVREAKAAPRTSIQSFDWRTLRHLRKIAPEIEAVCLSLQTGDDRVQAGQPGPSPWLGGLDVDEHGGSVPRAARAAGCRTWSPQYRDLTDAALAEARRLGLKVVPWTVNRPEDMGALIARGVDGIISDRPDLLRREVEAAGLLVPRPTPVDVPAPTPK